ncbi:MAG: hypothetical protein V1889_01930 [archaeon]
MKIATLLFAGLSSGGFFMATRTQEIGPMLNCIGFGILFLVPSLFFLGANLLIWARK